MKRRLIYFSSPEIQRLVEQLYPRFVEPLLRRSVGEAPHVEAYLVLANASSRKLFERKRRQTLLIGPSDGARLDILHRANAGLLANDQIVLRPFLVRSEARCLIVARRPAWAHLN